MSIKAWGRTGGWRPSVARLVLSATALGGCLGGALALSQEARRPADSSHHAPRDESRVSRDACQPSQTPGPAADVLSPDALAAKIDAALAADWQVSDVHVAPPADDAEFLRRASLDIVGKIPTVAEAREFLADTRPDKRRRLVDSLVDRGSCASHFANVWREMLLPGANMNLETRGLAGPFETWLKVRFAANVPYDELVSELVTARLVQAPNVVGQAAMPTAPGPNAFFQVNENKPENLAANTARIFLGMQVQCAQCHDHPFSHWRRHEFWALAAFFRDLQGMAPAADVADDDAAKDDAAKVDAASPAKTDAVANVAAVAADVLTIKIPDTDTMVAARFLDGAAPKTIAGEDPRLALSRWLTGRENPYFARAAVNRLWDHFFGRGFVDPVDDLDEANPPSHPELFAEISRQFVLHDYDLKYLMRTITATRAYQLSSQAAGSEASDLEHFARMPLRRMTAEQLYDSLVQATGFRDSGGQQQPVNVLNDDGVRNQFLAKFGDQSARRSEAQTSIPQALSLMNGTFTSDATSLDRSQIMSAIIELPFLDTEGRIETLYLATLTRPPDTEESAQMLSYVRAAENEKDALADIFWALLNSAEFIFNH
jgi:hypothetical protein